MGDQQETGMGLVTCEMDSNDSSNGSREQMGFTVNREDIERALIAVCHEENLEYVRLEMAPHRIVTQDRETHDVARSKKEC
jgi:hypothetical protein